MKFNENSENVVRVGNELLAKCFVYFLLDKDEVVYVGKTNNGLARPLSHNDKIFDSFAFIPCIEEELDYMENEYMQKYIPKYNKAVNNNVCKSMNTLKLYMREKYGFRFQKRDIQRICDFLNIKRRYFLTTEYIYDYEVPEIEKFIESNSKYFVNTYDGSSSSVIPKKLFKK